jgi:hypothetical protein
MRLFHDSIWTALGRCGFAAALPPYGPSLLRVSALTRGSRYREPFGDVVCIPQEMRLPGNERRGGGLNVGRGAGTQTHLRTSCFALRIWAL